MLWCILFFLTSLIILNVPLSITCQSLVVSESCKVLQPCVQILELALHDVFWSIQHSERIQDSLRVFATDVDDLLWIYLQGHRLVFRDVLCRVCFCKLHSVLQVSTFFRKTISFKK